MVRWGAIPPRSVLHWVQVVTGASITVVGSSTNGRSAFVCPGFAPRRLPRFLAVRLCFQSRDGGCDELREVVAGFFNAATSSCKRRMSSACRRINSIRSSRVKSRRFAGIGLVIVFQHNPCRTGRATGYRKHAPFATVIVPLFWGCMALARAKVVSSYRISSSLSARRRILPIMLLGNSLRNSTSVGRLYGVSLSRK